MVMQLPHLAKTKSSTASCHCHKFHYLSSFYIQKKRALLASLMSTEKVKKKKKKKRGKKITLIVVAGSPEKRALSFSSNSFT